MTVAVGATGIARAYLGGTEIERIYLGNELAYQEAGAAYPQVTSLTAAPAHNPLGAAVAGELVISTTATPAGVTITCARGDGSNIPARTAGVFPIQPVPTADETFTVTAVNAVNEQSTRSITYRRTTDPSWGAWTWTRERQGVDGAELVDTYSLTAEITCHPQPQITLTGDSYFLDRDILGGIDLNTTRHLTAGPGVRGYTLTITTISIRRTSGLAFDQTLTLRAVNPLTGAHADRSQRVHFGGA